MKRTLITLAIVLALCLPFAAHALNVPASGSSVTLLGSYCDDPLSSTASGSNVNARRAPQNCHTKLANGGFVDINIVVDDFDHVGGGIYAIDESWIHFFHVPTIDSLGNVYYFDGAISYPPGNHTATQWQETTVGSLTTGILYGAKFQGIVSSTPPQTNFCIDLTTSTQGLHFTKKTNGQFAQWSVDAGQNVAFVTC